MQLTYTRLSRCKMFSIQSTVFIVILLLSSAYAYNYKLQKVVAVTNSEDSSQSPEEYRQMDKDALLKKTEARIDEKINEKSYLKSKEICENVEINEGNWEAGICPFDPRNRKRSLKRKVIGTYHDVDEQLLQKSPGPINRSPTLENLYDQNLERLYAKRYQGTGKVKTGRFDKKTDRLPEKKRKDKSFPEDKRGAVSRASSSKAKGSDDKGAKSGEVAETYSSEDDEKETLSELAEDIRWLSHETSGAAYYSHWDDKEDHLKHVLDLADELMNKATGVISGDADNEHEVYGSAKHDKVADDYLRASAEPEQEAEPLSNVGFDFVEHRGDGFDDYLGFPSPYSHGRCASCVKWNLGASDSCPECKRNEHVFQGRTKRLSADPDHLIHHLEQASQRYGAAWQDTNKLYDFRDLEHDKFIDLSLNCTAEHERPNCRRLDYHLMAPRDAVPVPLRFVEENLSHGRDLAAEVQEQARSLQSHFHPESHSASMVHFLSNRVPQNTIQLNEESQVVLFGIKLLQEKLLAEYNLTPNTFLEFLEHHGFRVTGTKICRARQKRCNEPAKYRSIEGSCNNSNHPSWGQKNTAFVRILPARYSDDIHAVAVSVSGNPLPNARLVSTQLFSRRSDSDTLHTLALLQWGQILAHDFARQVIDQTVEGGIECCETARRGPLLKMLQHHSCLPIVIPDFDPFYSRHNQSCMNFVRSMTVTREDCSLGSANQLNGVSSFLDLSPVYGSDRDTSNSLREFQGGRMRTERRSNRIMMPTSHKSGYCDVRTSYDVCYETGDVRTNQNPQLVAMQTLFIRRHNRIAYELAALNLHWDEERIFQESRRILIAEYQHITYRHWLPLVLGKRYCEDHNIFPQHNQLSDDYDVKINPGVINSFTSAAFRFLHSMVEGSINLVADNYGISAKLRLSNHYFRPQIVEPNKNFESLLRGLVYQTIQKSDSNFHDEITEYLFRSNNEYGMDLESIDIQRGRDHGLPGYNAYREICHLGRAADFHGLINEISLTNIEKLESIYEHVDDIDLLAGVTMENRVAGSLLGPTLQCLIGEQFYRSRLGDRYFYNNANFPHSFTPEQFEEIKKASLATLICDLGEATYQIQLNPFKLASNKNPIISCFNLPRINLALWKEDLSYTQE